MAKSKRKGERPVRKKAPNGKGRETDGSRDAFLVPIPGDYSTAPRTNATGRLEYGADDVMLQVQHTPDGAPPDRIPVLDVAKNHVYLLTREEWQAWASWPQLVWAWEFLPEPRKPRAHPVIPTRDRKTDGSEPEPVQERMF